MTNLHKLQLDITAIIKDLKQNSTSGSRIRTLENRDYSMSEGNSASLLSNVETEKKKQKDKETNVIIHGFKKLSKHKAEETKRYYSIFERETDPVKIDSIGTTNEQNKQLLLVKLPNPKTKWELIRLAKKLRK